MSLTILKNALLYDSCTMTFREGEAVIENGRFASVVYGGACCCDCAGSGETEIIDCGGKKVIPGLIDVHTHGRGGFDYADATVEQMKEIKMGYAARGVTTVLPTLASATYDDWFKSLEAVKEAGYRGIHFEGNWLAPSKRGAHSEELLRLPNIDVFEKLCEKCGDLAVRVTVAPEIEGGYEFVSRAVELGAHVSIGHSNATYEEAIRAVESGADSFTHTYNAMSVLTHRAPGCVGAAMTSDAYAECICDGFHLHPAAVKLLFKCKGTDKTLLITDSMMATGMSDGEYYIAGLPVEVKDRKAYTIEGAIAGSTLDLWDGVRNFMDFAGVSLEQAIPCATSNPAKSAGLEDVCGAIREGLSADVCILDECGSCIETVIMNGEVIR